MGEAPSGTVTFLFTDIEGSTRLLARLRGGYADVLAAHHRLLRAALRAHGGHEGQTEGDAFFVAFARAHGAAHRRGDAAGRRLRRARRAPRGADLLRGAWWSGAALGRDAGARRQR